METAVKCSICKKFMPKGWTPIKLVCQKCQEDSVLESITYIQDLLAMCKESRESLASCNGPYNPHYDVVDILFNGRLRGQPVNSKTLPRNLSDCFTAPKEPIWL